MYDVRLTAEQLEIRDTVKDFVGREIAPAALNSERLQADDQHLPQVILDQASQIGLRTLALSDALGGAGADTLTSCIVAEELAVGDVGLASTLAHTSALGHILFDLAMTPEQRERFLPHFLGDHSYHLAYAGQDADPDVGGWNYRRVHLADAETPLTARRQDNGDWMINGVQPLVVNAPLAKLFVVRAKTDAAAGVSGDIVLLVPGDVTGMAVREPDRFSIDAGGEQVRGWFHGRAGQVEFRNCSVPGGNLLGAHAIGHLSPAAATSGRGSPVVQALNLGLGRAAYEPAIEYAKLRVQGGRPIIEHQAIGRLLGEIAIRLEVARGIVWKAAWAADHPDEYAALSNLPLQAVAKAYTSEAIYQVALMAAECFGAMGVMLDMPLPKYVHDALVFLHAETGNSTSKLRIAEAVAGYRRT